MTTTTTTEKIVDPKQQHQQRRVCFSFAAYAKAVIEHLKACRVPVVAGLSDLEFTAIEAFYGFDFPPDLRSILREGLPIGTGFPNWRFSSAQQLQITLSLPISSLLNEVSNGNFWCESWGLRPGNPSECLIKARGELEKAPPLVPIYRHFYIASVPNIAGNPIFYIHGGDVRCSGFDLADFFEREEFRFQSNGKEAVPAPAWVAKSARRVEVWTDLAEGGGGIDTSRGKGKELEASFKEMGWRLREGGWREEEVREMLMGSDGEGEGRMADRMVLKDRVSVMWHVRLLALALLRAGWSAEDVVYCMGSGQAAEENDRRRQEVTWQMDPTWNQISIEL